MHRRVLSKLKRHGIDQKTARSAFTAIALIVASALAFKAASYLFPGAFAAVQSLVGQWGLWGVFILVFLGCTLLPFPTDAFFLSIAAVSPDWVAVTAVAIVAAFASGIANYLMAYYLSEKWVEKQVGREALSEAKGWFDRWGGLAILLFGVLPLSAVFDPLTFVAGMSRMEMRKFAAWSLLSRIIHFAAMAILVHTVVSV